MGTIKSYTDIPQSCKLAEILPLESADMYWDLLSKDKYAKVNNIGTCLGRTSVYAWSLASLLKTLNFPSLTQNKEDEWEVCVFDHNNDDYIEKTASNPIDACYEMILKLHELKML